MWVRWALLRGLSADWAWPPSAWPRSRSTGAWTRRSCRPSPARPPQGPVKRSGPDPGGMGAADEYDGRLGFAAKRLAKVEELWRLDQQIMQAAAGAAAAGAGKAERP